MCVYVCVNPELVRAGYTGQGGEGREGQGCRGEGRKEDGSPCKWHLHHYATRSESKLSCNGEDFPALGGQTK